MSIDHSRTSSTSGGSELDDPPAAAKGADGADTTGQPSRLGLAIKRGLDLALALAALEVSAPLMAALIPAVKLSSPGPLFFTQDRVGRDGRVFRMYKLRTMRVRERGTQPLVWTKDDADRVTPVGSFLRDFGLDELPQIVNILRGDMSVIGPRPPLPDQAARFTDEQKRMFRMRPGVLSLAAIMGRRSLSPEDRIRYHVEYVERWSLRLDCEILWKSLFVVFGRQDAVDRVPGS